ncbi:MAG: ABC transporter ATP-binding protein [bacterium]|nr:ABC transporter ATP-binding protein [bacterium]MXX63891.1 ABC transporter ATP-binding protein [Acidimicrobiia bacterium]MCY3579620.1 ABC transporter ATP-binding protein [bacterium]MCY3652762.1 ABC transporter ATP-binding protein [bacterium]MDE0643276.1 ABC transporter ATP-binding protein [bacterium]
MDPVITFADVTKSFGVIDALDTIRLTIQKGEFVSLLGPSGCGKSTVLRLGSGLIEPTSGAIERSSDNIGYIFQEPTLMPWRTVWKNVTFLGELEGLPREECKRRAEEVLELVGLGEYRHLYPLALSGGMKMRTSIARSMLLDPDLFLFDEPFGALDQISRARLNEELCSLFSERHFAGLFVTHSVDEAVFLASRLLVMSKRPGRIVAEFEIPYEFPRQPEIRYEPEFAVLAGEVAAALEQGS